MVDIWQVGGRELASVGLEIEAGELASRFESTFASTKLGLVQKEETNISRGNEERNPTLTSPERSGLSRTFLLLLLYFFFISEQMEVSLMQNQIQIERLARHL